MLRTLLAVILALILVPRCFASSDRLVIHEWGTFTSLQDESGRTIGGVNSDDEPLPNFLHNLLLDHSEQDLGKGLPYIGPRQEITMRLETPVIYFHLPKGSPQRNVDVTVQFPGGLVSQFYPNATTNVDPNKSLPPIESRTLGLLRWSGVRVGTAEQGPKTDSHVWLAPRQVAAANVTTSAGESERYLFYRGVGHIDAPIVATQADATTSLRWTMSINVRPDEKTSDGQPLKIDKLWVANFNGTGGCQAVEYGPISAGSPGINIQDSLDRSGATLDFKGLRAAMKQNLVAQGLFDDEAEAMLNTWENSYFKTSGMRVFYMVPRSWTDAHLPLRFSQDADVSRVMIGRLEVVTSQQRHALRELAAIGKLAPQDRHVSVLYGLLGRFRNALLIDEQRQHPSNGVAQLLKAYGIKEG